MVFLFTPFLPFYLFHFLIIKIVVSRYIVDVQSAVGSECACTNPMMPNNIDVIDYQGSNPTAHVSVLP